MRLILAACHRGLAAVVVTHDAQLASWADRVVFLRDGRIVDQTLPAESPETFLADLPNSMSVGVLERPATQSGPEPTTGGVPARRAMIRWAWRLFKREWRQQLLILLLIIVAVAAVVVGSAVAVNTPPPANAGFGTAHDLATFNLSTPTSKSATDSLAYAECADRRARAPLRHGAGHRERDVHRPRLNQTYQLRSRTRTAPTAGRCCSCCRGTTRPGPNQIALTPGLASELNLQRRRHVVPGRQDRRRHRAEPPEPARRVRTGAARAGDEPDAGERPLRRTGRVAKALPSYVTTPGSAQQQHRSTRRPSSWRWRPSACS